MTDISVYVLKPFPFSRNGIKEESAVDGATIDLPERLFEGLNREGYVRRSDIGDGHVSLDPVTVFVEAVVKPVLTNEAAEAGITHLQPANGPEVIKGVVTPAPQPPEATSDLTEDELAALADGSWKDWRFFKQRSMAAKISEKPIKEGKDAREAIEAYIAAQAL